MKLFILAAVAIIIAMIVHAVLSIHLETKLVTNMVTLTTTATMVWLFHGSLPKRKSQQRGATRV